MIRAAIYFAKSYFVKKWSSVITNKVYSEPSVIEIYILFNMLYNAIFNGYEYNELMYNVYNKILLIASSIFIYFFFSKITIFLSFLLLEKNQSRFLKFPHWQNALTNSWWCSLCWNGLCNKDFGWVRETKLAEFFST